MKPNGKMIKILARAIGMNFDGGDEENRIHDDNSRITVFAHLMSEKEYTKMEKDLDKKVIKGRGYHVYAWNDCSGYKYWKKQGEVSDSNYIQITAAIEDLNKVDPDKLKSDMEKLSDYFSKYDNTEEFYYKKSEAM